MIDFIVFLNLFLYKNDTRSIQENSKISIYSNQQLEQICSPLSVTRVDLHITISFQQFFHNNFSLHSYFVCELLILFSLSFMSLMRSRQLVVSGSCSSLLPSTLDG